MAALRKLVFAGLALALVLALFAGSAAGPVVAQSVEPQEYCKWQWDPRLQLWCYYCCDAYGCYYEYCG